ncbi:V-type ATP synthase subunit D [Methanospirillum lacunae]|uniref:A-type ATP synthase subunit D n=1 Tax=Methanospirillum lacunae TaxID=668570 RepID=A0A2V2MW04_9EURY|nr:V-type ATP synthase subunit D [Methanospirillum lacunae]PWR72062.1 V-type ATP synthase subunit D [Methanospirillum lacunae]
MAYQTDVKPTRAGLLALKNRLRMARKAYNILSMKLDGLILEVTRLAPQVKKEHELLIKRYNRTRFLIAAAYMIEGTVGVTVAAYSVEVKPEIDLSQRNVFGVKVPVITGKNVKTDVIERGYGLLGTTLVIDDLADSYEELLDAIIVYAGNEATLKRLLAEIERISRRVKALEHMVIPTLEETELYISRMRDEMEREDTSRLFHVKRRKEEAAEKTDQERKNKALE